MTKLDKRTKEYKEWKKNFDNSDKGLGDKVEKVFKKTGIAKAAKWALGEDCGCDERKEKLNKLFPSKKTNCLTEDEYNYLNTFFKFKNSQVTVDQQQKLVIIYNRVFNSNAVITSCTSCFLSGVYDKLNKIFNQYQK